MLSCEEEVIKLITEVQHDTITVEKFIDRAFVGTDTVEINSLITETDTILVAKIDSIFIYKTLSDTVYMPSDTVYIYDTITQVLHHYTDTLVGYVSRDIEFIPDEYREIVMEFYTLVNQYGTTQTEFYEQIIDYWTYQEAPPANRSSFSIIVHGQWVLKVRDDISPDEAYTPIMREMARILLGKQFTTDDNIMNPSFDWKKIKLSDSDEVKKPYLDALFQQAI